MNAYQAQRIRFGILAARHTLARDRMTPDQVDYLEGCEAHGWQVRDSSKAYDRECKAIRKRTYDAEVQAEVLRHAWVITSYALATAEKWRYDRVNADFQEMIDAAESGKFRREVTARA